MVKRFNNPKEAIGILLLQRDYNIQEICLKLYGVKKNNRVLEWLREMRQDDWIISYLDKKDGRYHLNKIQPKFIVDSIDQDINLEYKNRKKLFQLFEKTNLMEYFQYSIRKEKQRLKLNQQIDIIPDFSPIKRELGLLGIFGILFVQPIQNEFHIPFRKFGKASDFAWDKLEGVGIMKNGAIESMKNKYAKLQGVEPEKLIFNVKWEYETLIKSFISKGSDFLYRMSLLFPTSIFDLLNITQIIRATERVADDTIHFIKGNPKMLKEIVAKPHKKV